MDSQKWVQALQTLARMVFERSKMNGTEPCLRSDILAKLGIDESCHVVDSNFHTTLDDLSDEIILSDDTIVLLDHAHVQRDQKFKYTGSRHAIALTSSGNGIAGCDETFHVDRMQLCLLDHVLYSPHRKVDGDERLRILERFGSDLSKYPKLTLNDPVVRFFGWSVNTLVEISVNDVPDDMHKQKYRVVWKVDDV